MTCEAAVNTFHGCLARKKYMHENCLHTFCRSYPSPAPSSTWVTDTWYTQSRYVYLWTTRSYSVPGIPRTRYEWLLGMGGYLVRGVTRYRDTQYQVLRSTYWVLLFSSSQVPHSKYLLGYSTPVPTIFSCSNFFAKKCEKPNQIMR